MAAARIPMQNMSGEGPVSISGVQPFSDEFALPIYQGIGAQQARPEANSSYGEDPEDVLLRLLRIHPDPQSAFVSCAVTWLANGCFAILILVQARSLHTITLLSLIPTMPGLQ